MSNEPTFDKHGYPTSQTLRKIQHWKFEDGYLGLMEYIQKAWYWTDFVSSTPAKDNFGRDVIEYKLVTGGWSGNEDIITAMEYNHLFYALCWKESHRGGKHIYEIRNNTDKDKILGV